MLYAFIKAIAKIIVIIFFPTKVLGRENIPKGGCILICNHFSAWDIPVTGVNIPFRLSFLGKKELFKIWVLGPLYRKLGAIPVDRKNVSPSTIKETIKVLKEGKKLMLFPEGTRNRSGLDTMVELKNGASMFALMAKVPIVPMRLATKPRVFRKNIFLIGEPIYFDEAKKADKDSIEKATEIIKIEMDKLGERLESMRKK